MNLTAGRTRRFAQVGLGALWLLDGALQLQPYLLGRGFATEVIAPAGQGQPLPVSASISVASHLILTQTVAWDALFAVVQITIGVLLLSRRTTRLGLAVSLPWAVGVWWFGEGAGQVLNGQADLLTGAPGAVLLYLLIGICVWPTDVVDRELRFPGRRLLDTYLPARPPVVAGLWAAVWASGALLRLLPGADTAGALKRTIAGSAGSAPSWLVGFDHSVGRAVSSAGVGAVAAVAAIYLLIGAAPFVRSSALRVAGFTLAALTALFIWVVGENFGALYSLQSTDPNSGPLLVLFALVTLVAVRTGSEWAVAARAGDPFPAEAVRPRPVRTPNRAPRVDARRTPSTAASRAVRSTGESRSPGPAGALDQGVRVARPGHRAQVPGGKRAAAG